MESCLRRDFKELMFEKIKNIWKNKKENQNVKDKTIFHLISEIFKKNNVNSVLIGGFAVNYYKVTRQTADIDFLITYGLRQLNCHVPAN